MFIDQLRVASEMMRHFKIQVLGLLIVFLMISTLTKVKNLQLIHHGLKSLNVTYNTTSIDYDVEENTIENEPHIPQETINEDTVKDGTYNREYNLIGTAINNNVTFESFDSSKYLYDSSHLYLWSAHFLTGSKWQVITSKWQVCLATQASVEHMFWLGYHSMLWEGPISVSVYVPGADYTVALHMIYFLHQCFTQVQELVTFHFLYPKNSPPELKDVIYKIYPANCQDSEGFNNILVNILRDKHLKEFLIKNPYPQNLARNIARQGCPCVYAMTPDIDMLANDGMASELNIFLTKSQAQKCDKCAYVIPVYEIEKTVAKNPRNKSELLQMVNNKKARQFHLEVYKPNQENSDLKKWESLDTNLEFGVAYNISNYKNNWEPIYVSKKANIPPFNEKFVGYGFTRNSQVYEMQLRGYHWKMLTNAFLCHRGFQTRGIYSVQRRSQLRKNGLRFNVFKKELQIHYKKS